MFSIPFYKFTLHTNPPANYLFNIKVKIDVEKYTI